MLSKYINESSSDWDETLPFATHPYNTASQKSTKFSPFYLVHGTEATTTFDVRLPPPPDTSSFTVMLYAERLRSRLEEARQSARDLADKEKDANKVRYDGKRLKGSWNVGDLVLVSFPLRKIAQSDKLQKRHFDPFERPIASAIRQSAALPATSAMILDFFVVGNEIGLDQEV